MGLVSSITIHKSPSASQTHRRIQREITRERGYQVYDKVPVGQNPKQVEVGGKTYDVKVTPGIPERIATTQTSQGKYYVKLSSGNVRKATLKEIKEYQVKQPQTNQQEPTTIKEEIKPSTKLLSKEDVRSSSLITFGDKDTIESSLKQSPSKSRLTASYLDRPDLYKSRLTKKDLVTYEAPTRPIKKGLTREEALSYVEDNKDNLKTKQYSPVYTKNVQLKIERGLEKTEKGIDKYSKKAGVDKIIVTPTGLASQYKGNKEKGLSYDKYGFGYVTTPGKLTRASLDYGSYITPIIGASRVGLDVATIVESEKKGYKVSSQEKLSTTLMVVPYALYGLSKASKIIDLKYGKAKIPPAPKPPKYSQPLEQPKITETNVRVQKLLDDRKVVRFAEKGNGYVGMVSKEYPRSLYVFGGSSKVKYPGGKIKNIQIKGQVESFGVDPKQSLSLTSFKTSEGSLGTISSDIRITDIPKVYTSKYNVKLYSRKSNKISLDSGKSITKDIGLDFETSKIKTKRYVSISESVDPRNIGGSKIIVGEKLTKPNKPKTPAEGFNKPVESAEGFNNKLQLEKLPKSEKPPFSSEAIEKVIEKSIKVEPIKTPKPKTPKGISKTKTKLQEKFKIAEDIKPIIQTKQRGKISYNTVYNTQRTNLDLGITSRFKPQRDKLKLDIDIIPAIKTKIKQDTLTKIKLVPDGGLDFVPNINPPDFVPDNKIPSFIPPLIPGGASGRTKFKKFKAKQRKKYTPSFSAFIFNIRGKAIRDPTGLRLRPIPKGFTFFNKPKRRK